MDNMKTGKDLRRWRKENRLSQADFCNLANYSVFHISRIESSDMPLTENLKTAIDTVKEILNPGEDPVIEAWRHFRISDRSFIRYDSRCLSETLPELLSTREYGKKRWAKLAYVDFLIYALKTILQIKKLSYKTEGSAEPSVKDITNDLYNHTLFFLEKMGVDVKKTDE